MSKAFTKDDVNDAPLLALPRRPLPEGSPNYVTRSGLAALRKELAGLLRARTELESSVSEEERPRQLALASALLAELEGRLASAELVLRSELSRDEARFGATVVVRNLAGIERSYRIVGVDEAEASAGRIAFVAPLARALLGKRVGDAALVITPTGEDELEIVSIDYLDEHPEFTPAFGPET